MMRLNTSVLGLLVSVLLTSPTKWARAEDEPDALGRRAPANDQDANSATFDLLVVESSGKPISGAQVEIRATPRLGAQHVLKGKYLRIGPYGMFAATDEAGELRVARPPTSRFFDVDITTPGYGPYWAGWTSDQSEDVPASFRAELEDGWAVGGIVVDNAGEPIEGVEVHPSIEFKKRPGDTRQLGVGARRKTSAAGRWRFDSVPASKGEVFVEINHPDFLPLRRALTRSEFGIEPGEEPTAQIVLDAGLSVAGKVTDEAGNPIAGALLRTKFLNSKRETKTAEDGGYRLIGCEPGIAKIVVSAKGRATDMREVPIGSTTQPVDFRMRPGGHVRIRVLDEHDKPIPKARILFQRWRGVYSYFEFGHVNQFADENGVWEWNEAPLDGFKADICRPDGMQQSEQPLAAREEEYVFRLLPALVVTGKVTDAKTKEPVAKFRVVPGIHTGQVQWSRGEQFTATEGQYRLRRTDDYPGHFVRIEAEGYRPAVSREIQSDEGNITIDFSLEKAEDVTATVLTPGLKPAVAAQAAIGVAGSQINVQNGRIDDRSTYCARQDTNRAGRFTFPAQETEYRLVITHPSGYADVRAAAETRPGTIVLKPWARVEGTFRVGKKPVANAPITLLAESLSSHGEGRPSISTHHDVTTELDGHFVFERVVPGRARVGRRVMMHASRGAQEAGSSCMVAGEFPGGATTKIDLGGTGRAVVGRLRPPANFKGTVLWNFASIDVQPDFGDERRDTAPYLLATADGKGRFHLDDVPAGKYVLVVRFYHREMNQLSASRSFSVSPEAEENAEQNLDLGEITLE